MVSPVLSERRHSGGFLVSESRGERSRDQVTLLQQGSLSAPSAPSLTPGSSGSLPTETVYVKVTYVGPEGETAASAEASASVTGSSGSCAVSSPSAQANPTATGWNIYAATAAGAETRQNAAPIAIGTNYTITAISPSAFLPPTQASPVIQPAGLILGEVLVGTSAAFALGGSDTGNPTCGTITIGAGVVEGVYAIEFIAATVYEVFLPNGQVLGEGHTGSAFSAGGLGFTLTAGGTAAVVGDTASITIAANANVGLYAPLNLGAADGTQNAAAILFNETDASQGNTLATIISRAVEVNGSELVYPAAATAAQITAINAQLQSIGIIVR